ncbi:MAG: hypothetical protein KGI48_06485, partial [Hyphomicrobiales bacterium]|nr:hypothetical protein [Hyphomicrobiales bacterium]
HATVDIDTVEFVDLFGQRFHGATAAADWKALVTAAPILTLYLPGTLIIASSLGIRGLAWPQGGASLTSRLTPKLNLIYERPRGQKTTLRQYLKAIRGNLPRECLRG